MEEGRKFNTNYPTNKPSSIIHYRINSPEGVLPDFLCHVKNLNNNLVI